LFFVLCLIKSMEPELVIFDILNYPMSKDILVHDKYLERFSVIFVLMKQIDPSQGGCDEISF